MEKQNSSSSNPRSVDFSGVQLTITSASILSDVFTIEWGLRKLVFRECDLDDQVFQYAFSLFYAKQRIDTEANVTRLTDTRYPLLPLRCFKPPSKVSGLPSYRRISLPGTFRLFQC